MWSITLTFKGFKKNVSFSSIIPFSVFMFAVVSKVKK